MMRAAKVAHIGMYYTALLELLGKSPSLKMKFADREEALSGLQSFIERSCAVEVGDYLILYDVGTPWYSKTPHFFEELTIRFQRVFDNPVSDAVRAMKHLALAHGAKVIMVGDTQVGLMVNHYQADGYNVIGTQLLKDISNGIRS